MNVVINMLLVRGSRTHGNLVINMMLERFKDDKPETMTFTMYNRPGCDIQSLLLLFFCKWFMGVQFNYFF